MRHHCLGTKHIRTGGRDRLAFFAECSCGWTSRNRATRAAADEEHRHHVTMVKLNKRVPLEH